MGGAWTGDAHASSKGKSTKLVFILGPPVRDTPAKRHTSTSDVTQASRILFFVVIWVFNLLFRDLFVLLLFVRNRVTSIWFVRVALHLPSSLVVRDVSLCCAPPKLPNDVYVCQCPLTVSPCPFLW